ncbi:MAG: DNA polymerase III subunit alpha, partial [Candidatus Margulisiibacteriota bacterium]
ELKQLYQNDPDTKNWLDTAAQLEGFSRHTSTHAAGIVISREPLKTLVPLIRNEGQTATQYSMTDLEKLGLLKMDILGLRNLTVMSEAVALIQANRGILLDLDNLPLDDTTTYAMLSEGHTFGVFQLESQGMRQLIRDLKPQVFEDIIALLALYRPGPLGSGMVSDFISNKSGTTKIKYDLPQLEPILKDTYGLILYQEQVMQIASVVGGFTLGEADVLRRAMGKKKKDEMDRMKAQFLAGAKTKAVPTTKAERIFELCYKFAEYGFNKSHSAAYALISFQTAYLKAHYAPEYMTALLSSVLMSTEKLARYIQECRRMDIAVLPPDINVSDYLFSISDKGIVFGLGAVKNAGEGAIEGLLQNRKQNGPFLTLFDLCRRSDLRQINKRVLESLIKSGACDSLGNRAQLLATYEHILESAQAAAKRENGGEVSLFGEATWAAPHLEAAADVPELSTHEKLRMERELLGLYLTGHPLDAFRDQIATMATPIEDIAPGDTNKLLTIIGVLSETKKRMNRAKRGMVIATLSDLTGEVTIMAFEENNGQIPGGAYLADDQIVKIRGRVRINQDEISLICQTVEPLSLSRLTKQVHIDLGEVETGVKLEKIRQVCMRYRGENPVYLHTDAGTILTHNKYWIAYPGDAIDALAEVVGPSKVWLAM